MGEPTFSYSIENDRLFKQAIDRALLEVNDLKLPFNQIAFDWYKSNKAMFLLKSAGKYPDFKGPKIGQTWATGERARPDKRIRNPSMTAYQDYKFRKYGFDYPLLKATSRLEKSITDPKDAETIFYNTGTGLVLGSQVPYGIYHQSDAPRKKIPLRKFLFIGPEAPRFATTEQMGRPERWLNIINNYIVKKMGGKVT